MIIAERYNLQPLNQRVLTYSRAWPLPEDVMTFKTILDYLREFPLESPWLQHMILDNVTSEIIGNVGFQGAPVDGRVFLAYALIPSGRGRGAATITSRAMIKWAFENGASVVDGLTRPHNDASIKVCERLGFQVTKEDDDYIYWELKRPDSLPS
jgi:RimJ/RimL family protein N-acetyltransferase